jgi:hypothetical protein
MGLDPNPYEKLTDAIKDAIEENASAFETAAQIGARRPSLYTRPHDARKKAAVILETSWTTDDSYRFPDYVGSIGPFDASDAINWIFNPQRNALGEFQELCNSTHRRLVHFMWPDETRQKMYDALMDAIPETGHRSLMDAIPHAFAILHKQNAGISIRDITGFLGYLHRCEPESEERLLAKLGEKPAREIHEPPGLLGSSLAHLRGSPTGPMGPG